MIAESTSVPSDVTAWAPGPVALGDLELLLSSAYRPLTGFLGAADTASVRQDRRLADGTPWPVPITLHVPEELAGQERLILQDPEGVPLALLTVTEAWQDGPRWCLAGPVRALRGSEHGAFRRLRRRPDDLGDGPVLAVPARTPLHRRRLGQLRQITEKLKARVLVLPLLGGDHDDSLVRAVLAVRKELPAGSVVVPVPLAHDDALLGAHVAAAYGATHLLSDGPVPGSPIEIVVAEPWAYDTNVEVWRPTAKIEPDHDRVELSSGELTGLLDRGEPLPDWFTPPAVAAELRRAHPPRHERGLTVFFTGLSGSGKSTVARGLADALVERGERTVTLLDGDVVRRMLSAGLSFSRADRDLNIRRIGFVATEITRHGGVAICAPIAPYAATRAEVRRMVRAAGDFVLIHVATPLEECERRDRKGLYAKARAGLIPEFTGISDPYEAPADADLVIDTSTITPEEATAQVIALLAAGGWVRTD